MDLPISDDREKVVLVMVEPCSQHPFFPDAVFDVDGGDDDGPVAVAVAVDTAASGGVHAPYLNCESLRRRPLAPSTGSTLTMSTMLISWPISVRSSIDAIGAVFG